MPKPQYLRIAALYSVRRISAPHTLTHIAVKRFILTKRFTLTYQTLTKRFTLTYQTSAL